MVSLVGKSVLVVAAHPDDEALGCGGTIVRHVTCGADVQVLFLADGEFARPGADTAARDERREAACKAAMMLGTRPPIFGTFPDNRLDTVALLDVVRLVERTIAAVRPDTVYTHHGADLNVDHRIAFQAVLTACRPIPECPARQLLAFETLSSTEWSDPAIGSHFRPDRFHD